MMQNELQQQLRKIFNSYYGKNTALLSRTQKILKAHREVKLGDSRLEKTIDYAILDFPANDYMGAIQLLRTRILNKMTPITNDINDLWAALIALTEFEIGCKLHGLDYFMED